MIYLGIGSNLGQRGQHIERALLQLKEFFEAAGFSHFRISPLYETSAMIPPGAPADWNKPYLNIVVESDYQGDPAEFLNHIHVIERSAGRERRLQWQPRPLDIDILYWHGQKIQSEKLCIPHAALCERSFFLDPLKDLNPGLVIDGVVLVQKARRLPLHIPLVMAILNITPDSFSSDGLLKGSKELPHLFSDLINMGVHVFDIGAESTRPGATLLSRAEELERVKPVFDVINQALSNRLIRPILSLDTRRADTAALGLENGFQIINDVSGLSDPGMVEVLQSSDCDYVLMHNLGIPAGRDKLMTEGKDVVLEVRSWLLEKLEFLDKKGISSSRVLFDPGIGFGKSAHQSLELLSRIEELHHHHVRLMLGHSRKSFMGIFTDLPAADRDIETLALSLKMMSKGIDVIRVHNAAIHLRALRAWAHVRA